jgi:hypothetical protein
MRRSPNHFGMNIIGPVSRGGDFAPVRRCYTDLDRGYHNQDFTITCEHIGLTAHETWPLRQRIPHHFIRSILSLLLKPPAVIRTK